MSSILIRRANMVAGGNSPRLPAGYTELAYLEGTGTQYINTNVMCSSNNVEVQCKCTHGGTTAEQDIISNQDGSTGRFVVGTTNGNIFMYSRNASGAESTGNVTIAIPSGEFDIKAIYDKTGSKRTLYVNGVSSEKSYTRTIVNSNRTILVFAGYNATTGSKQYFYLGKIYYIKYKEDGVLIFDYVPAMRDSDSVVGMYDLVSDNFLTNAGSGTFNYGTL